MSSKNSILKISTTKSRYTQQDELLRAFVDRPDCTAKEVAVEALNWRYERYCNAPKRAHDLASKRWNYLEICGNRECRQTATEAHIYRVTERGLAYLQRNGLLSAAVIPAAAQATDAASKKSGLAAIKAALD